MKSHRTQRTAAVTRDGLRTHRIRYRYRRRYLNEPRFVSRTATGKVHGIRMQSIEISISMALRCRHCNSCTVTDSVAGFRVLTFLAHSSNGRTYDATMLCPSVVTM